MPKVTQPKEQIWTSKDSRSLKLMSYIFNQKAVNPANQELPVWCEACQLNLIPAGLSNWGVWWGGGGGAGGLASSVVGWTLLCLEIQARELEAELSGCHSLAGSLSPHGTESLLSLPRACTLSGQPGCPTSRPCTPSWGVTPDR